MPTPYGKEVGITYDWNGPEGRSPQAGDVLQGKTRCYLILSTRRVNSTRHHCRWRIRAVIVEDAGGAKVFPIYWNRRSRG